MNLILTMAGKYSRFKDEGFRIPKFLLPWGSRSILGEILFEMRPYFDNVYLIANKNDSEFLVHVSQIMKKNNIPQANLLSINDTDSQSETLLTGINQFPKIDGPIIVHNIDTILYGRDFKKIRNELSKKDGYIDIFHSNNPNYSYIINDKNKVINISEKTLISSNASSGMYGFSSAGVVEKYYVNGYISEIYQKMIADDLNISSGKIHSLDDTIVLGTPNEYSSLSYLFFGKNCK